MKILFIILSFVFLTAQISFAQNSQILNCEVKNGKWISAFTMDSMGTSFLQFKNKEQNILHTCGLKLDDIEDGQTFIAPSATLIFKRGRCEPSLGTIEKELFERFTLIVNLHDKAKPEARVQWLRKSQPDNCKLTKFSLYDISKNADKWSKGTWGRKTASDPKDFKPTKIKK